MKKNNSSNARWLDFASYNPRRDSTGERVLEISVELQREQSTRRAASFLHQQGIKLETALRVLTQPGSRRALPTILSPAKGLGASSRILRR